MLTGEWSDLRHGPAAIGVMSDVDGPVGKRGRTAYKVDRTTIRCERRVRFKFPGRNDPVSEQYRFGQRFGDAVSGRHRILRDRESHQDQQKGTADPCRTTAHGFSTKR